MASLALAERAPRAIEPTPLSLTSTASKAQNPTGFSTLEWSVVMLARHDRPSSLREPGRIMKLLSALVGNAINRQLADPKLEALRRMAVLTWHQSYAVPKGELTAFFDAGYSPDHYELLGKRVAEAHVARLFRK
ncbi:hypothetical protein [Sphingopyxis panaciterrulae]|uniref:Uncharacterized protein n=1 Tax=Sphingopyxis panaciterrulae TaxID=462372 RepID=A0A7W9EPH9_9SPHN|nr:hypothetical protein [Sphingopyxis panaciterrulae]MBB5705613.1 hypothetical protein [Sphingopyxis panaciterrulae]